MSIDFNLETDVAFSHSLAKGLFGIHIMLFIIAVMRAMPVENGNFDVIYAEFGKIWTCPWYLCLQASMCLVLVYWTKRKYGSLPTLPNETNGKTKIRQSSESQKIDFTKGPLLRRVMQRIKYCKMKLSPVQYIAKGLISLFIFLVVVTYVIFCFGAPLNFPPFTNFLEVDASDFSETTLAFGLLMTLHTALPIVLVYGAETIGGGILYVFLSSNEQYVADNNKLNNDDQSISNYEPVAQSLYISAMGAFVGAWFGAFPIPLDWDRPWQIWPISCNIGLAIGVFGGNLVSLIKTSKLKEKTNSDSILTSIKTKKS